MGVRGLTTYIDARPYFCKPYRLHDTKVIIDGSNLIHFLYASKGIDCVHGGDYKRYAVEVKKYLARLKECNVEPIIVLDGGCDVVDYTYPKRLERFLQRVERVNKASITGTSDESFVPINIFEVFKSVISEMGVCFVQCDYESDSQVAALANHFDCPVMSDDSDFYIFDIKQGFIRLSHIDKFVTTIFKDGRPILKHLKCDIYRVDTFFSSNPGIRRESLPLLGTLIGNDFLSYNHLKNFYYSIQFPTGRRLDRIIEWVRERQVNEAVSEVLECTQEESKAEVKLMIKVSMDSYKLEVSNLIRILDDKATYLDKQLMTSKIVTPCGALLPKKFITAFNQGRLRGYFVTIINLHRLFLSPQVEDHAKGSSYDCSRYIRRILYGILLQHDAHNVELHRKLCTVRVQEYDHCNGREKVFRVEPVLFSPKGLLLPTLSEIYQMGKKVRQDLLADVMAVKKSVLSTVSPDLQLLLGCIIYWLMNCFPKPIKEFVASMILSIVYYLMIQTPIVESSSKTGVNEKSYKYYSILGSISESERQVVSKRIAAYLVESNANNEDSFRITIVHCYSQLQTCLLYIISLNKLLDFPFESPKLHEMFDGTVLYNMTIDLLDCPLAGKFVEHLLGKKTASSKLFDLLLDKILKNIPEDFPWTQPDYRAQASRRESGRNVPRNNTLNIVEVSNKFQNLCSLKRR